MNSEISAYLMNLI